MEEALLSPAALVSVTVSVAVEVNCPVRRGRIERDRVTPLAMMPDAAPAAMVPFKISTCS